MPLYPDDPNTCFNWQFFDAAPNALAQVAPDCAPYRDHVKLIDVPAATGGGHLEIVMDGETDRALGYLKRGP
jgi:hypothetical protein